MLTLYYAHLAWSMASLRITDTEVAYRAWLGMRSLTWWQIDRVIVHAARLELRRGRERAWIPLNSFSDPARVQKHILEAVWAAHRSRPAGRRASR